MNATSFTVDRVRTLLDALADQLPAAEPREIVIDSTHSNALARVRYGADRTLMVKRARYTGMAERFETSRAAAALLREYTRVVAPEYLDVPAELGPRPFLVYWRIDRPTLEKAWSGIPDPERAAVLRGWGELIHRIHRVRLPGHGPLLDVRERPGSLEEFLHSDITGRMRPSTRGFWVAGAHAIERLADAVPVVVERVEDGAVLVHNDLFTKNVLCEPRRQPIRCIGVLDLEDALAAPPEADLAKTELLHGPLFGHEWTGAWFDRLLEGYRAFLDPLVLAFFRAYHLINMGMHAANAGMLPHANEVAGVAERELGALDAELWHREVVDS